MRFAGSLVVAATFLACVAPSEKTASDSMASTPAELARARSITSIVKARCTRCHTAGKTEIRRWAGAMQAVKSQCLAPGLPLTAVERVDCLRGDEEDALPPFSESKLGFYAAATRHTSFKNLFAQAGVDHTSFVNDASMPPAASTTAPQYTEQEFANLESWINDGMPALDEAMVESGQACVPSTSPKLRDHLARMKQVGWAARHLDSSMPMFGCTSDPNPLACMSTYGDRTGQWGVSGVAQTIRQVYELPFSTYAWMRSSADGRFHGFGGQPARVLDLSTLKAIKVSAEFDAAFLPDNTGFAYANTSGSRVSVCKQSVLLNAAAQANPSISLTEPGCSAISSADYQALGASLDGSLFLMASGTHENDITFSMTHGPLSGSFDDRAVTNIVPMVSTGTGWTPKPSIPMAHPFEGDGGLSPSNELLYTRFGTKAGKRGFRVRKLTTQINGTSVGITSEELATVCVSGGKVMPSFDERFLITHQYVDPAETPELTNNSSNIILIDLLTGETIRLTNMARGQYAFSPTFRADGWIYFLLRDANTRKETLVATDAAVRRL